MRHFSDHDLICVWDKNQEYKSFFETKVNEHFSKSFIREYLKCGRLHDWYLSELSVFSPGKNMLRDKKNPRTNLKLSFVSHDRQVILIYKNINALHVEHKRSSDVRWGVIGFGCCLTNRFDVLDERCVCHGYFFEGGVIEITGERILFMKQRIELL